MLQTKCEKLCCITAFIQIKEEANQILYSGILSKQCNIVGFNQRHQKNILS